MNRYFTFFIFLITFGISANAQNGCDSWIPRDGTFQYVPFTDGVGPYNRNDDGSTDSIVLPFKFCFWNQQYTSVYINNNGNISFGTPYAVYSPDSFPSKLYEMIAPFWGDVDTRNNFHPGSNVVIYKIQPHYMIVQWDSVAYYTPSYSETDSLNSFQLIISDGTDPIIPRGNNVSFTYRTMHWTTGDASNGINGYGGYPATVGANEGDSIRYVQIGLFDTMGAIYTGQFPPAPHYDGVAWLDNKNFLFNLCSGQIAPLVSGISPCDTFKICVGDSAIIPFYYFSPVQGDSVWSKLSPPIPPGVSVIFNHPGPTDSITIKIVGSLSNVGDHTVNLYGYDNDVPPDTTYTSFVVEVDIPPTITLSAKKDTICQGDTALLTASGGGAYLWSTGATTSSIKVAPPVTTVYSLTVTSGGCIKDTTLRVTVVTKPKPHITSMADSICQGDTVLLVAGGGGFYIWNNGKTTDSIYVIPTVNDHTYVLNSSNGVCDVSTSLSIKIIPPITDTLTAVNDTVCPHGTTKLIAQGLGGQSTYKWSTGQTSSSITVNDTVTTVYTVTAYGLCDSVQKTMTVTVIQLPKPVITGNVKKCKGQKDTLVVTNSVKPATYLWSNGKTTSTIVTGDINADSTFYVIASNSLGCSVTDTFHIAEQDYPTGSITYPPGCGANITTITAHPGGTGPFTYQWNTGGTNDTIDVLITGPTTYTVTISNGCPIIKTITVIQDVPALSACCSSMIYTGSDTIISANGASIVKYRWMPDTGLNCDTCATVIATPTVTTTYTVIGTDAAGCTNERTVTIVVELPCFNPIIPNVFTPGNGGLLGLDKVFYIKTQNMEAWSLTIYDRWGKEVFKSSNPNEYWDGNTEGGASAPAGVYYYIISGTCQNNSYKKDGFIQLIR